MNKIVWTACFIGTLVLALLVRLPLLAGKVLPDTISVEVNLVDVLITVSDKHGRPITSLTQDSFTVFEDESPQTITSFNRETDLPLAIVVLIDTSGSIRDKLRFEQAAAKEFFCSTLRPGVDKAALLSFETGVEVVQDYTDNPLALADAVTHTRWGGGTSLYDAVYQAVEKLATQQGRKIVILISDGKDTTSHFLPDETLESALRHEVTIYTISTNSAGESPHKAEKGNDTLKTLAAVTGGEAFLPEKLEDVAKGFRRITMDLRTQYKISYHSTNPRRDGAFRKIRLEVGDKHYRVNARAGYYALPPAKAE